MSQNTLPRISRLDCHRHSAALLVLVADLNRIADVVGIELDQASRHP